MIVTESTLTLAYMNPKNECPGLKILEAPRPSTWTTSPRRLSDVRANLNFNDNLSLLNQNRLY